MRQFFTDDHDRLSMMRLAQFVCVTTACLCVLAHTFFGLTLDLGVLGTLLGIPFAGKSIQKFAEKRNGTPKPA